MSEILNLLIIILIPINLLLAVKDFDNYDIDNAMLKVIVSIIGIVFLL